MVLITQGCLIGVSIPQFNVFLIRNKQLLTDRSRLKCCFWQVIQHKLEMVTNVVKSSIIRSKRWEKPLLIAINIQTVDCQSI